MSDNLCEVMLCFGCAGALYHGSQCRMLIALARMNEIVPLAGIALETDVRCDWWTISTVASSSSGMLE